MVYYPMLGTQGNTHQPNQLSKLMRIVGVE